MSKNDEKKRVYRKRNELFLLIDKMKLWPSKTGIIHGIRDIQYKGDNAIITTHCGLAFTVRNSRSSRAARWLRNKWGVKSCPKCKIPEWKMKKYAATIFADYGSDLSHKNTGGADKKLDTD